MIGRAVYNLELTRNELRELVKIRPWKGDYWTKPPNQEIIDIKTKIKTQLENSQKVCSYCGLALKGTSNGEIEHIAPKNKSKHPEFTFTLKNLTLACHYCNFPEKKGQKEVLSYKSKRYSKCEFLLVHPYLDDPNEHYEWTDNSVEILIQVKNNSEKALFSIDMFGLDTPEMNQHRAMQVRFDELQAIHPLSNQDQTLLNDVINYKQ